MFKDYLKYHIPLVLVAAVAIPSSFYAGPRTPLGTVLLFIGSASLLLAPPVSLLLVRRKYMKKNRS